MNKTSIIILDQQSWRGGGQRVLRHVLTSLHDDFLPTIIFPDCGPFQQELQELGYETITCPLGTYQPGRKSVREKLAFGARSAICALWLTGVIIARRSGLIYVNGARCLPFGAVAGWLTQTPVIFHFHNVLSRRGELILVSRLARIVEKIIVCSNASADSLLKACPGLKDKMALIRNCAQPSLENAGSVDRNLRKSGKSPFTIGIVGRITEIKGHEILLRSIAKTNADIRSRFRLIIVGGPGRDCSRDLAYLHRLESLARETGLEEQIVWTGHQDDLEPYYAQMDAVVIPSTAHEGGGPTMVALEAMQREIPLIVSGCGGNAECFRDEVEALVVPAGNTDALACALAKLLQDPGLRRRLAAAARNKLHQQFSPAAFSYAIHRLVSEACLLTKDPPPEPCAPAEHQSGVSALALRGHSGSP